MDAAVVLCALLAVLSFTKVGTPSWREIREWLRALLPGPALAVLFWVIHRHGGYKEDNGG